ncbi:hypothetical protein CRYO30217_01813 [Parvicella tangerina]|uniref:Uncharacterized protein n=1 Tax=Parvicella tangerina TaxID=2829795 RepID=A0A916JNI1_9FLAO|nr:hypothetical protein CRYO30217_01813 [Parvicella tangerina]
MLILGLLFTWSYSLNAQTTLKGYITQYEHGDTIIDCKVYNKTLVFDKGGREVHSEWLPPSHQRSEKVMVKKHFMTVLDGSHNYTTGWTRGDEESTYTYIHDTLNKRYHVIEGTDTAETFITTYDKNKRLISKKCLDGCHFTIEVSYANPLADTIITTLSDGEKQYTITEFDEDHRRIYSKYHLDGPDDKTYLYTKFKYKDQVNMVEIEHGETGTDHKEVNTIFSNKKGFPVYETLEIYEGEDKVRWVIQYEEE